VWPLSDRVACAGAAAPVARGFEKLSVKNDNDALFEGPAMPENGDAQVDDLRSAFCDALRNCTSLQILGMRDVNLWADTTAASQLIAAMEGLPALNVVQLSQNHTDGRPAVQRAAGECMARLIAHSSSLRDLELNGNDLGVAGMTPIFEALRCTSTLTELSLREEQFSPEFVRDVVLPAVRANTSLRNLEGLRLVNAGEEKKELLPELQEVEDILAARRLADTDA